MQYIQNISDEPISQHPIQNLKHPDGLQRGASNSIHDYHFSKQEIKGDNHEIESIISLVYQRKQDPMQNQSMLQQQYSYGSPINYAQKQAQNNSLAFSNRPFEISSSHKINPWDSQGSLDGGQQVNLDDFVDPEEVPQYDQMHIQHNALLQKTQKTYSDFASVGANSGNRAYHDPVVKKIVYTGNAASLKRVDKIQEKVQSILNHKRERSDQLEIKFAQTKQKIANSYCAQISSSNQLMRSESNKHKNYLINENMNTIPIKNINNNNKSITKKTNEFAGSIRYIQEPKEVTLDLASNKNTKSKNYPYLNKLKSASNHIAQNRSSSASKRDNMQFNNNQNKMLNQGHDLSQNSSGILQINHSSNVKQFQTPVKRLINIQIKNQNEDITTEKKIRDKSLSDKGSPQINFKTPLKSEDTVLKQKNTNTQLQGQANSPLLQQENHKQHLKESGHSNNHQNNPIINSIKKNQNNHLGYDSERALRPYTAQTPAKKAMINSTANALNNLQAQERAHHMAPDNAGLQSPNGGNHQNTFNQQNSCLQNDLFDSNVNIQQYRVEGELGKGAYATVKLGIDKSSGETFALKIYQKFTLTDPNKMRNVKREISILKRLSHPNIIKMPHAFQDRNTIVLVMECLSRVSLHSFLKKKQDRRVPESEAKMIFHQLVSGIDYCHMRNIVHRDVKLENILIDEATKNIKVIDFGFSICTGVKLKIFCGTPTYMAPEIVSKVDYCGKKADIWALGIVLYVLLCGKFPFRGMNDSELFKKIRNCVYDPPTHASDKCQQLLKRLLKFNPQDRPDCYEILQDPWFYSG